MKFYCVKCREKKEVDPSDTREERRKAKGKTTVFAVAKCPECGTEMWRIVRRE